MRTSKDVLQAARAAARVSTHSPMFWLNMRWMDGHDQQGYPDLIQVPLDITTELHAAELAKSRLAGHRVIAADVLAQYSTPLAINSLRALLSDPAYDETGHASTHARFYFVRHRAHKALMDRGIQVSPPQLEDRTVEYVTVLPPPLWIVLVAGAVIAAAFLGLRRRGRISIRVWPTTLASIVTSSILLAAALCALWFNSVSTTEDLIVTTGHAQYRVTLFDGTVQCMQAPDWNEPGRVILGSFARYVPLVPRTGADDSGPHLEWSLNPSTKWSRLIDFGPTGPPPRSIVVERRSIDLPSISVHLRASAVRLLRTATPPSG